MSHTNQTLAAYILHEVRLESIQFASTEELVAIHSMTPKIHVAHKINPSEIIVTVQLTIQTENGFLLKVKYLGRFERKGDSSLSDETFCKVNAPAIIYPYLRAEVHHLITQSGLPAVILPLINFTSTY